MLTILSPAKKQDFLKAFPECQYSKPSNLADIKTLSTILKDYKAKQLSKLMSISDKLAKLNFERYQAFEPNKFNVNNAKPAVFAFQGDVYQQLKADELDREAIEFMQHHLLILSGLYGYLRPLDLIQPYRLEMKTPLKTTRGRDLYEFWGDKISKGINKLIAQHSNQLILNLASNEYFKAVKPQKLQAPVVNVEFKENKNGQYKTLGMLAKRARGMMARYIMQNQIDHIDAVLKFNEAKYRFNPKLSTDNKLVFTR